MARKTLTRLLQVERAQINELVEALAFQAQTHELQTVIGAGLGEFLIAKAALKIGLEFLPLSSQYGRVLTRVPCIRSCAVDSKQITNCIQVSRAGLN